MPCGQRRCRVARRIMACRGRERGFGTFCPSGEFTGAPGNGETGRTPQGTEIHAISQTERALLPAKPSASSYRRKRGALQGTPHCPSRKTSPARAQDQRSAPVYDPSAPVYDPSAPVYDPSAPVYDLSTPVYGPFRAIYDLPTPLRSSHVLSGRSVPFAAPPRPHGFCAICGASPAPLRLSYTCLWPLRAICDTFRVICGASSAFTTIPGLLIATPRHLRRIQRFLRLSHTFCGHSVPFTAFPCLFPCYSRL